jgi:CDP-glucose 4,6-dehydratase
MTFKDLFKGKKVLITGNTGFKGSWLTVWLQQMGAVITGLSKDVPTEPSLFKELKLEEKIDHHILNIKDGVSVQRLVNAVRPDYLFHLAAQPIVSTSYQDPIDTFETNVIGTGNILEALRIADHPCIAILITSDKCYDNVEWTWGYRENDALGGKDPYSASKAAAELIIRSYYQSYFNKSDSKIKLASVRAGNVIGGGDWALNRIVPDCVRAWAGNEAVSIRNPASTRPWQHVLEPLSGYLRIAELLSHQPALNGEAFNFGPSADQSHTVLSLLKEISQWWSFKSGHEHFSIKENAAFHEAGLLKLNCDKALHYLQWSPVLDFFQTSRMTGEWYNQFYNRNKQDLFGFTAGQINEFEQKANQKGLAWAQ